MTQAAPTVSPAPSPPTSTHAEAVEPPVDAHDAARAAHARPSTSRMAVVGTVLASLTAALLLRVALDGIIGTGAAYLPFGLAVLISAAFAGRSAGLAASVPGALLAAFVPAGTVADFSVQLARFALFVVTGVAVTVVVESLHRRRLAVVADAAAAAAAHDRRLAAARREHEEAMEADRLQREKEQRFRMLVESVADYAIFMLDTNGRVVSWNAGAERIKGYTADEVLGRHFSLFYLADDQRAGRPAGALKSALREGRHEDDGWRVRKDGTRLWANVVIAPVRQDGELLGFAKVVRDMTRRHGSDVLLESVLASAIDGIIGIDENGTMRSFNAAAERMFDYPAAEVVGLQFSVLLPEPYRSNAMHYLARFAHTAHSRIVGRGHQLVGLRGDGTTFPLELAVSDFVLDGKRYFTGVVRDLTRQRALEEQLQQAQKMHAIGQLAGGVAHDFNNLLTIIAGHTELLLGRYQADEDADQLREALTDIRDAGMRAAGLTRQLLAFSRRAVLDPKILDLNTVVRDAQKMLRRIVGEDVEMVTRLAPKLRTVSVDQSQIGQVLVNLVVNARDAMPHGGLIEIETSDSELPPEDGQPAEARPRRGVRLTVRDNGIGMTPDIQKRIFEPFFTTKETGAGTGLGLSMVYGIVRQSGGQVTVRSTFGSGSEFSVFLPVAKDIAPRPMPPRARTAAPAGDETLLIVEDEESVRRLAVMALREQGYRIIEACNGAEALRMLGGHDGVVDLVVTDVVMPVMGGRQLVEALRTLRPNARVLYVSGYTDDAVVRHGVQRADVAFLQKPYSPHELAEKVRRVLDRRD